MGSEPLAQFLPFSEVSSSGAVSPRQRGALGTAPRSDYGQSLPPEESIFPFVQGGGGVRWCGMGVESWGGLG